MREKRLVTIARRARAMGSARGDTMALRAGRSLEENLEELVKHFPVDERGYFGTKGVSRREWIRNIATEAPGRTAAEFAAMAAANPSVVRPLPDKGFVWIMRDGSKVTYRWASTSDGTPVVELSCNGVLGIADQKIHFVPSRKGKR